MKVMTRGPKLYDDRIFFNESRYGIDCVIFFGGWVGTKVDSRDCLAQFINLPKKTFWEKNEKLPSKGRSCKRRSFPLQVIPSRCSWTLHRNQTCRYPGQSSRMRLGPSPSTGSWLHPLDRSTWIRYPSSCISPCSPENFNYLFEWQETRTVKASFKHSSQLLSK